MFTCADIPRSFWNDLSVHREYLDQVATALHLSSLDDWYNVSPLEVKQHGGSDLLKYHYEDSLVRALTSVYTEHSWKLWKFSHAPVHFWKDVRNHREYFTWLAKELRVEQFKDWYKVRLADVLSREGAGLLMKYYGGSLIKG